MINHAAHQIACTIGSLPIALRWSMHGSIAKLALVVLITPSPERDACLT